MQQKQNEIPSGKKSVIRGACSRDRNERKCGGKVWGKERSLLLYIDETETLQMCFTDGPWLYLTEEPVERIKAAGMARWAEEAEVLK